jgi:hypothetical protein
VPLKLVSSLGEVFLPWMILKRRFLLEVFLTQVLGKAEALVLLRKREYFSLDLVLGQSS